MSGTGTGTGSAAGRPAGRVRTVLVGTPRELPLGGRPRRTAIARDPAVGPVRVLRGGLEGDRVGNTRLHGHPDMAVYAYARADLDHWECELGGALADGAFGENLTTTGPDPAAAVVGERWRVGTALLEVTRPRTPCATFAGRMADLGFEPRGWVRRFAEAGRPGTYLAVVEEGVVEAGDPVVVEHVPTAGPTVGELLEAWRTR